MSGGKRVKKTGKGADHSYIQMFHFVMKSPEWGDLDGYEVKLLMELAKEYKGNNNGDLSAAFSVLKSRGWRSSATLNRRLRGLVEKGWLLVTRHGGSHRCSLYAITWWPLNECSNKTLYGTELRARNTWRKNDSGSPVVNRSTLLVNSTGPQVGE
jgi:hypothetical protein